MVTFALHAATTYDQIGRGGLSLDDCRPAGREPLPRRGFERGERDDEIRQMLEARNERRARRGQEPLDIEAELARARRAARRVDPGLAARSATLVDRPQRAPRARMGKEPLDVEAEVARQLRELGGGGA